MGCASAFRPDCNYPYILGQTSKEAHRKREFVIPADRPPFCNTSPRASNLFFLYIIYST